MAYLKSDMFYGAGLFWVSFIFFVIVAVLLLTTFSYFLRKTRKESVMKSIWRVGTIVLAIIVVSMLFILSNLFFVW